MYCPICLTYYNKQEEPCMGICGHSVCGNCFDILTTRNCPICRAEDSFVHKKKFPGCKHHSLYGESMKMFSQEVSVCCFCNVLENYIPDTSICFVP